MYISNLLVRSQYRSCTFVPCLLSKATRFRARRAFATHRESVNLDQSTPLSQSLDTNRTRELPRHDSVGPFQLGLSQAALRQGKKQPKWSELSTGGKVIRTTARTTNLTVILLGAGLSALLIYSLTSELFSKNSPTVLYGDACERIKNSPRVAKYLNSPLVFHNNPPSVIRPRHRNRHVTSQIMVDAHGHEHMIMTFYVQGKPEGFKPSSEYSYLESASQWAGEKYNILSEVSADEALQWAKDCSNNLWERGIRAFKYLSGAPLPSSPLPTFPAQEIEPQKHDKQGAWSFAGMFSSLKGTKSSPVESVTKPDGRVFTDGEVHADLIRNNDGYFVFRYLLIDIPSSRDRNSTRVFVERGPGVRENEPVMRWNS